MTDRADVTAQLAHDLAAVVGAEVTELRRLTGGASRETWRFHVGGRDLVLHRQRPGDGRDMMIEAATVRAAAAAGVPVPMVVAAGTEGLGGAYIVSEAVEGETIARKILRDDDFAQARGVLAGQLGAALATLHRADPTAVPGLPSLDQVVQYREMLDALGAPHPTFELVFRWLEANRPPPAVPVIVHGDFRLGNVIVGPEGLRAVLDWELAHVGDPMEDLGWLCVKAWRFGGAKPVAGLGERHELFDAYAAASGATVDPDVVRWWEVLGTLKWGIMCIIQANAHLAGFSRSHELAAIGRRVCENEHDLFVLLDGHWDEQR
jgi:aminoglycoside phosphotransferase (APT) family kinase protein